MSTRHVVVDGLDDWITGLERLGDRVGRHQRGEWETATEMFYGRTQGYVHVLSGAMKQSGRYDTEAGRRSVEGWVTYGGTKACDYAVYEIARGGSHDALTLGYVANIATFEQALVDGIAGEVREWL